jgi:hypothetical protein
VAFKSIFDPNFRYRNANSTDVGKTFKRIKREQKRKQRGATENEAGGSVSIDRNSTRRRNTRQSVRRGD